MTARRASAGFTLLELVVVLAVFALVTVMSLQALQGTIRSQSRLTEQSQDNAALAELLVRLRRDLEAAVPLAFTPPGGGARAALEVDRGGTGFALSLGGQPVLPGDESAGLSRVEWRYDADARVLTRAAWLSLIPAQAASRGPDIVQMQQVEGLEIASMGAANAWQPGWEPAEDDPLASLPRAIRVRIITAAMGRIDLVERF